MTRLLDTINGLLVLPNGVTLRGGLSLGDVTHVGVTFVRVIELKTGWAYRTTQPYAVDGHAAYFALGFDHDRLATVEFGFTDLADMPAIEQRHLYDSFLKQELGSPDRVTVAATPYEFAWGRITSHYDPRTDSASVIVRWT